MYHLVSIFPEQGGEFGNGFYQVYIPLGRRRDCILREERRSRFHPVKGCITTEKVVPTNNILVFNGTQ